METDLLISTSLVTLGLAKRDFFMSAFPGKIIMGHIINLNYVNEQSFLFYRHDYNSFFEAIVKIVQAVSEQVDVKGVLLNAPTNELSYLWELNVQLGIKFLIEKNHEQIVFSTIFNLDEFNNFLDSFKELMLPSLLLRKIECDAIKTIANLEFKKVLEMSNFDEVQLSKTVKCIQNDTNYNNCIVIKMNFDIILLLNKLQSLVCTKYRSNFKK